MYVCNKYLLLFMTIYFGVSLQQVHYQDWNVKNFFVPKHFSFAWYSTTCSAKAFIKFYFYSSNEIIRKKDSTSTSFVKI